MANLQLWKLRKQIEHPLLKGQYPYLSTDYTPEQPTLPQVVWTYQAVSRWVYRALQEEPRHESNIVTEPGGGG